MFNNNNKKTNKNKKIVLLTIELVMKTGEDIILEINKSSNSILHTNWEKYYFLPKILKHFVYRSSLVTQE